MSAKRIQVVAQTFRDEIFSTCRRCCINLSNPHGRVTQRSNTIAVFIFNTASRRCHLQLTAATYEAKHLSWPQTTASVGNLFPEDKSNREIARSPCSSCKSVQEEAEDSDMMSKIHTKHAPTQQMPLAVAPMTASARAHSTHPPPCNLRWHCF